jgi:DNA processing protein
MEYALQHTPKQSDLSAWILLAKAPGLGPVRIRQLLQQLDTPEAIINANRSVLKSHNVPDTAIRWLKQARSSDLVLEMAWLEQPGHHCISVLDQRYPVLMNELHDAPALLFVKGDVGLLSMPQLAIVGSRNPSVDGKQSAFQFSQYLAAGGLVITSGLAQGVDAQSHLGALSKGRTIAVCATGLDRVYPSEHHKLAHQIAENGALVSEFLPGTEVHKAYFPRRNRLISGLSIGTLVVEAGLRSGSLITAQCALEQGREVFAIPGSIHNPMSKGCHRLIKQGAKLVENAADIIEELQSHLQHLKHALHSEMKAPSNDKELSLEKLDPEYRTLLDNIGYSPISIDELIEKTGFKAEEISSMLLILELDAWVKPAGSGRYSRS